MNFQIKTVRKTVIISLFLILIIGFIGYVSALTGSIGNARMIIRGNVGDSIDKYVLVKNVNNESVDIEIEKEGDLAEYVTLKENKFRLGPGEDKKAEFTIKIAKEGTTETRLNIKFAPIDGKNGVGLSSTIIVVAEAGDGSVDFEDEETSDDETSDDVGSETDSTSPIDSITQKFFGENSQISSNMMSFKGIAISLTLLLVIVFILLSLISKKRSEKEKGFNENKGEIKLKKESVKK